jgi:hypothetical protein
LGGVGEKVGVSDLVVKNFSATALNYRNGVIRDLLAAQEAGSNLLQIGMTKV